MFSNGVARAKRLGTTAPEKSPQPPLIVRHIPQMVKPIQQRHTSEGLCFARLLIILPEKRATFPNKVFPIFQVSYSMPYTRPTQPRKLEWPNYQHKLSAGRKCLFHIDVEISLQYGRNFGKTISCRGRAFATISAIVKALAGRMLFSPALHHS